MIPVELYGVNAERCERLYDVLPALVDGMEDDDAYGEVLYAAEESNILSTVERADAWADATPFAWPDDVAMEVEMALRSARVGQKPFVSLACIDTEIAITSVFSRAKSSLIESGVATSMKFSLP